MMIKFSQKSKSMVGSVVLRTLPSNLSEQSKSFFLFPTRLSAKDQGLWDGFMSSVNARMNVAKIVDELRQDAALTFDFVVLIVIAG